MYESFLLLSAELNEPVKQKKYENAVNLIY